MYKSCLNRQSSLNNWFSSFGGNLIWYSYHQNLWMSGFQIIQLLQSNTAMFFQWCHFYSYKSRAVLSAVPLVLVKMGVWLLFLSFLSFAVLSIFNIASNTINAVPLWGTLIFTITRGTAHCPDSIVSTGGMGSSCKNRSSTISNVPNNVLTLFR